MSSNQMTPHTVSRDTTDPTGCTLRLHYSERPSDEVLRSVRASIGSTHSADVSKSAPAIDVMAQAHDLVQQIAEFVGKHGSEDTATFLLIEAQRSLAALTAAPAAPKPAEAQWAPIETAPRDGRRMLVAIAGVDRAVVAFWNGAEWETVDGHHWTGRALTHWMPIPPTPAAPQD